MWPVVVAALGVGCGRIAFEPHEGGSGGDAGAIPGDAAGDAEMAAADLLLHLAFDSDGLLIDRSEAHHPVTCTGPCPSLAAGRVGDGAARFTGTECLRIADAPELRPASMTFSAWAWFSLAQTNSVFSRAHDGDTTQANSFELYSLSTPDRIAAAVNTTGVNGAIQLQTWHHLAGVYDLGMLALYIDGSPVPTVGIAPLVYANDDIYVGCERNLGSLDYFWFGDIDDVRLYARALSSPEVAALAAM